MAVHAGTLKTLSGGTHQGSTYAASSDWRRLEFVAIGDERIKDVHMLNYHYELLKTEVGKDVALSLFTGGFTGETLGAVRLSDGSVEKIPDEFSHRYVTGGAQMFLMTLLLLGVAAAGVVLNIPILAIGTFALALFIGLSLMRTRGRASRMQGQIRAAIRALDGSAGSAHR